MSIAAEAQCSISAACGLAARHQGVCRARLPATLAELERDWMSAGGWLRRRDASSKLVSPLMSLADVVALARKEHEALIFALQLGEEALDIHMRADVLSGCGSDDGDLLALKTMREAIGKEG